MCFPIGTAQATVDTYQPRIRFIAWSPCSPPLGGEALEVNCRGPVADFFASAYTSVARDFAVRKTFHRLSALVHAPPAQGWLANCQDGYANCVDSRLRRSCALCLPLARKCQHCGPRSLPAALAMPTGSPSGSMGIRNIENRYIDRIGQCAR